MPQESHTGQLFVIAVPIGNLEDITLRAVRLLKEVDLILCEDTRTTGKLLELLGIGKRPLLSLHEHNESGRRQSIADRLYQGQNLALVSDAGTPAISDPGQRLISGLTQANFTVTPVPGACAAIAALCASGLSTRSFLFLGFPPQKTGALTKMLSEHKKQPHTLIFYVGPHHLVRFIEVASQVFGADRRAVVGRELTKKFEEFVRGPLSELPQALTVVKGEVVIIIEGQLEQVPPTEAEIEKRLSDLLATGMRPSVAAKTVARELGCARDDVYRIGLKLKERTH